MESHQISRRRILLGLAGIGGLTTTTGLLGACGDRSASLNGLPSAGPAHGARVSVGANFSDPVPRAAMRSVVDAFEASTGIKVDLNTVDPKSFQNQMSAYLQGIPDDVFTWFGGYRMRFFAGQGLTGDLSDLWGRIGHAYSDAFERAATGDDGAQYLVPFHTYPWVVMYRKRVWAERGYSVPTTREGFVALAEQMQADALIPLAFGNREGWPAMGTFDILNMRLNGYDFHIDLAAGTEAWTDPRVKAVFDVWRGLLPYHQRGAQGRTWQEAARTMLIGDAGMYFAGTFAGEQADEETLADLDFFTFPSLGTRFDEEAAIDAPVNGFMMSPSPSDRDAALAFLGFVASGPAQTLFVTQDPTRIAAASDADTSGYSELQQKMVRVISGAGRIAQFMDRDSRPDFTGPNGLQSFLQDFLADPEQDLDPYLAGIQRFWESLES
jgi:multiple sugar transport system substrate-binding protein